MFCRPKLPIIAAAVLCAEGCFSTLPMSDSYAQQAEKKIFEWLAQEPMLEAFPVNYDKAVTRSGQPLRPGVDFSRSYALTMLRNAVTIEDSIGKPLREKYRSDKRLTISAAAYSEDGKGSSISDIADMRSDSEYAGKLSLPGVPGLSLNALKGEAPRSRFSGSLTEKIQLNGSIAFKSVTAIVDAATDGDYVALRNIDTGALMGLNIPGLPVSPSKPMRIGEQWEVTGYTEQKTKYRYPAPTPPASLAAATLVLMTYQFNGYTDYNGRACAYIEFFGETYEMRDFGGKSSLAALKAVARTLSRSPISEVRTYLARRDYGPVAGMKGSFQASAKLAGYALVDAAHGKLVLAKTGKEGLTGGGSSLGMVKGTGKGVFREQWILEEKPE